MRKIILFAFIYTNLFSQNYNWDWLYGTGGKSDEIGPFLIKDNNENLYLSGNYHEYNLFYNGCLTRENPNYNLNGFIININKEGKCKCVTDFFNSNLALIGVDSKNNIYYSDFLFKDPLQFRNYKYTPQFTSGSSILAKFDSNCNLLWVKEFGDKNQKWDVHISTLTVDALDNIILSGTTSADTVDFGGQLMIKPPTIKHNSIFLVKFNSDGEINWLNSSKLANWQYITKIQIDHESNIIIAGNISKAAGTSDVSVQFDDVKVTTNGATYQSFVLLYKFTPEGKAIWGKLISGPNDISGAEITLDSKDNIYVGASFSHNYFVFKNDTLIKKDSSTWFNHLLLKYDKNGLENWAVNWDPGRLDYFWPFISTDKNDNVWCHFNHIKDSLKIGNKILSTNGNNDCALLQFNAEGENLFAYSYGSKGFDGAGPFVTMNDGSLIVSGDYNSKEFSLGNHTLVNEGIPSSTGYYPSNIFLARFAPDSLVSNHEIKKVDVGYSVYPNPASDNIIVSSKEDINDIKTIELYNLEGKRSHIKFKKESSNKMSFSGKELLDGVYLLKILTDDGVENIKIQIQH